MSCDTQFQHDVRLCLFIILVASLLTLVLVLANWFRGGN